MVLWGEGWHPGVVGICASRMAERHVRPAILIALDAEGRGKGSGRSVPGFDLLGALRACGESLARFGGHRAAAGLEIEADRSSKRSASSLRRPLRQILLLADRPLPQSRTIDAVVGTEALGPRAGDPDGAAGSVRHGQPRGAPGRARARESTTCARWARRSATRGSRFAAARAQVRGVAFGVGGTLASAPRRVRPT